MPPMDSCPNRTKLLFRRRHVVSSRQHTNLSNQRRRCGAGVRPAHGIQIRLFSRSLRCSTQTACGRGLFERATITLQPNRQSARKRRQRARYCSGAARSTRNEQEWWCRQRRVAGGMMGWRKEARERHRPPRVARTPFPDARSGAVMAGSSTHEQKEMRTRYAQNRAARRSEQPRGLPAHER